MNYYSQCKHSEYVRDNGKTKLLCHELSKPEDPEVLATNWTYATYCPFFQPEKRQYRTRKQYREIMRLCDIPLEAEKDGILAHVTLL